MAEHDQDSRFHVYSSSTTTAFQVILVVDVAPQHAPLSSTHRLSEIRASRICRSRVRAHLRTSTVRNRLFSRSRDVPAAGGPLGALFNHQALVGAEQVAASPVFDINNTSTTSSVGHWDEHSLLLTNPVTTPLDDGYGEMDRLLELLPSPTLDQGLDIGLSSVINNTDDWNWLNEGNF